MPWYNYNSGSVGNPNSYNSVGTPNCPTTKNFLCAIQASDNMGAPNITPALILEIANAVNSRTESTNVQLRPTP